MQTCGNHALQASREVLCGETERRACGAKSCYRFAIRVVGQCCACNPKSRTSATTNLFLLRHFIIMQLGRVDYRKEPALPF